MQLLSLVVPLVFLWVIMMALRGKRGAVPMIQRGLGMVIAILMVLTMQGRTAAWPSWVMVTVFAVLACVMAVMLLIRATAKAAEPKR